MKAVIISSYLGGLALLVAACQDKQPNHPQPKPQVSVSSSDVQLADSATFNKVMNAKTLPDSVPAP